MIDRIDHVGIAVRSIEEARPFYEALGLEITEIEEVPQEGVRVALIPCGESRIELLEATSESSPIQRFIDRRGPGMHHLCLRTETIVEDGERLREAGMELLRPEPTRGASGCWVQFVHPSSSGGVLIEMSQAADPESDGATGEEARC